MLTDILKLMVSPKVLSIAGGFAGHRWLGKGKPSWQPYAYAVGGALAGYALGTLAQKYLPAEEAPKLALPAPVTSSLPKQLTAARKATDVEYVELGPPKAVEATTAAVEAEATEEDQDVLDSFTSSFEVEEEEA